MYDITINDVIISNLKKYYPQRLSDFLNGSLEIKIRDLKTKSDKRYLKELKQKASITDIKNNLILGFNFGLLFIKK